ncbi:hypothetical protein GWG65_06380 [Bradyrhizobium sp. CSA207]|uniref:hypothetical protein n=1 Tax=Bradyrhizobium sp. CSA207 TaxID=2698826 RepID=UPI0023AF0DFB|nr:hypothetical protein [Bradyrhizobium sp. CSA207]MDE5441088.1 hypothetical protein [Bradyrhizobium sp. CSA207]
MNTVSVFAWALFGGAFCELLHWGGLKRSAYVEIYARSIKYWLITVLMIIAGGLLATAMSLSGSGLTPLTAILVGYSAPSLIQKLAKNTPTGNLGARDMTSQDPPSIRGFLIG